MTKTGLNRRNILRGRALLATATTRQIGEIVLALGAGPILDGDENILTSEALGLPRETQDLVRRAVNTISDRDLDDLVNGPAYSDPTNDNWLPANGGKETPLRDKNGRLVLYCFNPAQRRHAYIALDTDTEIPADEAERMFDRYATEVY